VACGAADPPSDAPIECVDGQPLEVETDRGVVRSRPGDGACAFLGIPYAMAPTGTRRWAAPDPPPAWNEPLAAVAFPPRCLQLDQSGLPLGDEDCLGVNLWVPPGPLAEPRPVLVFFHGGGNVVGASSEPLYDGAHLAGASDAVVVTANYRLGPLGFLTHADLGGSTEDLGNYGLLDQMAVLRWVQQNAGAFGGSAQSVLAFGQSAGGRNLCAIAALPEARSLFRAVAIESAACELNTVDDAVAFGQTFVEAAGCSVDDVGACLRGLDAGAVLNALPDPPDPQRASRYMPNEGYSGGISPLEGLAEAEGEPLSVLVGSNRDEPGAAAPTLETAADYETLVREIFGDAAADLVLERYPASSSSSPTAAYVRMVADWRYRCSAIATAAAASARPDARVHRYLFSHARADRPELGAFHGLELLFLFGNFDAVGYEPTDEDLATSDRIARTWTSMARSGEPGWDAADWPEAGPDGRVHVVIAPDPQVAEDDPELCPFWEDVWSRVPSERRTR
jgi:para-nitrobenzyl esterase